LTAARVLTDIAYAEPQPAGSRGHLLDLHLPGHGDGPVPLVIWSHGSGWLHENGREGAEALAAILNPRGFAVAGVAIRSSAHARFPAQVHDVKAAIRWLRAHAERHGLDPERFAITGESSGAWAAAMAGVTADVPGLDGDLGIRGVSSTVQAVVAFYPPTDFLEMDAHMLQGCMAFNARFRLGDCHADARSPESLLLGCAIGSCPDRVAAANPAAHVGRHAPPFLIVHGQRDLYVPWEQSALLYAALDRAGGDATFFALPHAGHGFAGDPQGLEDPAVTAGATVQRTEPARGGGPHAPAPSWDFVARWLDARLRPRANPG
jgi:acetyl esterase/lipase